MISPLRLAELVEASYTAAPTWHAAWPWGRIRAVRTVEPDGTVVVSFPGTENVLDVMVDLAAIPRTIIDHPQIGPCHAGSIAGLCRIVDQMTADLQGQPHYVVGHSLGGAFAHEYAGIQVSRKALILGLCTFGAMRCVADGNELLPALLATIPATDGMLDYRHRDDPVAFEPPGFSLARPQCYTQLEPWRFEVGVISDHLLATGYIPALTISARVAA